MHRLYIHPLPVRIWHWINAATCVLLVLTGLQIRYVGLINAVPFRIVVVVHNWLGYILIANFFVWFLFYLFSDKIRVYHPELNPVKFFRGSLRQALYYGYGIFKGSPNPFHVSIYRKFNPLQAMTYQIVMLLLLPIQCFTGLLLLNLTRFAGTVAFFGGVRVVDTVHVLIFIAFVFYIPFHAYLGTLGRTPTEHFKAMFTGYEELEESESADKPE
ncbi:MAG TPA: cytochrome b/b6 domain-containing protein [Alphaproteobacteria bacterium]|nr:cytochrome b/b6 domain-containing protein [Alphaproteobacteria bacterium]